MGTGKTRTSIEWAKKLGLKPIIVVPKGLVENWLRECSEWGLTNFTLITKEKFKALAHTLPRHDCVIIDEAHYFAGKSQMNKAMQGYLMKHRPSNILALSGTPYMRNAWNVYRLGLLLGASESKELRPFWSWYWFDTNFFSRIHMGARVVPVQKSDDSTKKKLANLVKSIGSTRHLSDCVDVPESQEYIDVVEKTDEQEEFIKNMTDIEPIVRYTKEQQAMGGIVKADEYKPEQIVKSNKVDRLMELAGQQDKIMIVCRYRHEIEYLRVLALKTGRNVFVLHGDVKNRDDVIQEARKSDDAILIVGAQISEGWEAPEFETMVFYSHSFSLKDYVQMKGRIQRINNLKPRCYVHLLVEGSVDVLVYKSLMNKEDFLTHIYAKTRSKTNSKTP